MQNGVMVARTDLTMTYIPQLQTPPLHLAVMVAKDSPLLIDCPAVKYGGISTAHSDLDAALAKFRMTAYMWQALTAEDMSAKGLGRRSFRLEEEWTSESLSKEFVKRPLSSGTDHMRSTAKIHLIRSDKTVSELRTPDVAQQNEKGKNRDALHAYFEAALKKHGGPFASSARPIVAGLILDATYDAESSLILGHAALGCHNPHGISLGVFGSHLTYSWPRFLEEVPACLLDTRNPGDNVGNDNNECGTLWEACSVGQGAFLHEVGHAFGAPHSSGIMMRGYAQDWPKCFLSRTAYCEAKKTEGGPVFGQNGGEVGVYPKREIVGPTENNCTWDLTDALAFKMLPHFRLPGDVAVTLEQRSAEPSIAVVISPASPKTLHLVISSPTQIVRIKFNDTIEENVSISSPITKLQYTPEELESRFPRKDPLKVEVLGMNGKIRTIANIWRLFANVSFILIPNSPHVLHKRSTKTPRLEAAEAENVNDERKNVWDWAVLLNEKGADGKLKRATAIDSRVGCILDGAVVYFADGHTTPCGPRWRKNGGPHNFGGHASEKFDIPAGVEIVKVEVGRNSYELNGLRFHLSDGSAGGYLYEDSGKCELVPGEKERIVGFYGRSEWGCGFNGIQEFGIITVGRDVELPESVYDMVELKNTDGGNGPVS